MIRSTELIAANARKDIVRRKRYQNGSLQVVSTHGKRKMWILQYRDGGSKKYHTIGLYSKMSKSDAQQAQAEFMKEVNLRAASAPDPHITFGDFLEGVALPFLQSKWKRSTRDTTENRIRHHLLGEFAGEKLLALGIERLQAFLAAKAKALSKSVVAHLRWDLRALFKLATAGGYIMRDPTPALFTPKEAKVGVKRVMNRKEALQHINALPLRERVIDHLALFAGMRPGEILALQRKHVAENCGELIIEQRLYRGDIDDPKTALSKRKVGIPPQTAEVLSVWLDLVELKPDAWLFASENPAKPLWRDNVWYRHMKPKLETVGLEWANFQVLRRTHASLGNDIKVDPKVAADQRGHGIGVALDVYTQSSIEARREAAEMLANAVLSGEQPETAEAERETEEKRSDAA
jgi:integrase